MTFSARLRREAKHQSQLQYATEIISCVLALRYDVGSVPLDVESPDPGAILGRQAM
jgi:hypothetical protein